MTAAEFTAQNKAAVKDGLILSYADGYGDPGNPVYVAVWSPTPISSLTIGGSGAGWLAVLMASYIPAHEEFWRSRGRKRKPAQDTPMA